MWNQWTCTRQQWNTHTCSHAHKNSNTWNQIFAIFFVRSPSFQMNIQRVRSLFILFYFSNNFRCIVFPFSSIARPKTQLIKCGDWREEEEKWRKNYAYTSLAICTVAVASHILFELIFLDWIFFVFFFLFLRSYLHSMYT